MASVKPREGNPQKNARAGCRAACCDLGWMAVPLSGADMVYVAAQYASHRCRGGNRQSSGPESVMRCEERPAVHSKIYGVFIKAGTGRVTASARAAEHARNRYLRWLTPDPNHFNTRRQKSHMRNDTRPLYYRKLPGSQSCRVLTAATRARLVKADRLHFPAWLDVEERPRSLTA